MSSKSLSKMNKLEKLLFYAKIFKFEKMFSNTICANKFEGHYQSTIDEGKVVWSNNIFANFFGFKNFKEINRDFIILESYVDKYRREELLDMLSKDKEVVNFDSQYYRKDGSIFWMRLNSVMIPKKSIIEGYATDVTDLKEAQKQFEDIVQNSLDIICESNLDDGCFSMLSESVKYVTGHNVSDLLGKPVSNIYSVSEDRENIINTLMEHGEIRNLKVNCRDVNNDSIILSGNFILLRDENQKPTKIRSYLRDVTKLIQLEEKNKELALTLAHKSKMESLGLLAGGVAHDLNNILSGIVTYPEFILMNMQRDDPLKPKLEIVHRSGKRAAQIVNDLLIMARRGIVSMSPLDIETDVIQGYFKSQEFEHFQSNFPNISVNSSLEGRIAKINGCSKSLQSMLANLVQNSAESIKDCGDIFISLKNEITNEKSNKLYELDCENYVILSVSDTGEEIEEEERLKIFEPFYTKKVLGRNSTGMEMSIVWGVVEDHNGYIDIRKREGGGNVFDICFPSINGLELDVVNGLEKKIKESTNANILVVDDVLEQRMIATEILKHIGYIPKSVASGEEAVSLVQGGYVPDLVILDMIMDPGIDGLETYKRLVQLQPNIKAIIASGYSQSSSIEEVLRLGARSHVRKPYSVQTLKDAISQGLEN